MVWVRNTDYTHIKWLLVPQKHVSLRLTLLCFFVITST